MARNLFSIPIFFIVFRECLEASIIVSVLLGLVEQIVSGDHVHSPHHNEQVPDYVPEHVPELTSREHPPAPDHESTSPIEEKGEGSASNNTPEDNGNAAGESTPPDSSSASAPVNAEEEAVVNKRLVRKLRFQIFFGALSGFVISLALGAAFVAVWFTQASNLWQKSENLWEGIFSLIASILIFVMGITMLKMDRAKAKWKVKLQLAFEGKHVDSRTLTGKWVLFILPFITVLREGMEAVVFVGGVAIAQPAAAIPIATIVGIICGLVVGYLIYAFSSRTTLSLFLIVMTNFLLLIGAGLFSKAVGFLEKYMFSHFVGAEVDDTGGDGPGSYRVPGNVWHLDCCNPENTFDGQGWNIFAALFGWTNSATFGTVLSYVFYWLAVMAVLTRLKWREGRTTLLGRESAMGKIRRVRRENRTRDGAQA